MSIARNQLLMNRRTGPGFLKRFRKKPIIQESGGDSTRNQEEVGKQPSTNLELGSIPSSKLLHLSCSTLIYGTMLQIILTKDLTLLLLNPKSKVSDTILQKAWDDIVSEYCELIQTKKTRALFEAWRKIKVLECKVKTVQLSLFILYNGYNKEVAEQLFFMGYDLAEDIKDEEQYIKQIKRIEIETKNQETFLLQAYEEYKSLLPKTATNEIPEKTLAEYEKDLAVLSRFMGYRIDKDKITASEHAAMMNIYIEHSEKQEEHGNKKR